MRVLFYGTPKTAVPFLESLLARHEVAAVVTQPDQPAGRGLGSRPSPVKQLALERGLRIFQPKKPSEIASELKALAPDVAVAVAYGRLLKADALAVPKLGTLNVHFSLLPKYRGAAPVQWSLVRGEKKTGVSIFWLDEGMDTGPVMSARSLEVGPDENAPELLERLTALGVEMLAEALTEIAAGRICREPQRGEASLAPLIKTEDARVDLARPAEEIHNLVRGMRLWPRAWLDLEGSRLIVLKSALSEEKASGGGPGRIERVDRSRGFLIQCGSRSCLWFVDVQPDGKKPTPAADFLNGLRLGAGDFLPWSAGRKG